MKTVHKFIDSPIKIALFAISLIVVLVFSSFFVADKVLSKENVEKLGIEKSIDIVLDNANLHEEQVYNLNAAYSNKGSSPVYEISFDSRTHTFSYTVNAHTGDILFFNKKILDTNSSIETNTTSSLIDLEKAKSIVLADISLKSSDVIFKKTKLDKDDDIYVYEIEFDYNNLSYEYEINAYSGAITDKDIDD